MYCRDLGYGLQVGKPLACLVPSGPPPTWSCRSSSAAATAVTAVGAPGLMSAAAGGAVSASEGGFQAGGISSRAARASALHACVCVCGCEFGRVSVSVVSVRVSAREDRHAAIPQRHAAVHTEGPVAACSQHHARGGGAVAPLPTHLSAAAARCRGGGGGGWGAPRCNLLGLPGRAPEGLLGGGGAAVAALAAAAAREAVAVWASRQACGYGGRGAIEATDDGGAPVGERVLKSSMRWERTEPQLNPKTLT